MKKVTSLLLAVILCLGLTVPALATQTYAVIISDGVTDYTGYSEEDASGEGWSYDSVTKTLTLNGFHGTDINCSKLTKIVLIGDNTCEGGILLTDGPSSIEGNGTLTVFAEIIDKNLFTRGKYDSLIPASSVFQTNFENVILKDNLTMFGGEKKFDLNPLIMTPKKEVYDTRWSATTSDGKPAEYVRIAPAGSLPDTTYVSKFTDVPASSPYAEAIGWAVENGITTGKTATTFAPDETCTRGQITTFLWRASGSPSLAPEDEGKKFYKDSVPEHFLTTAVWAYNNGLACRESGKVGEAVFGTYDPCTRLEVIHDLYMLSRYRYPHPNKESAKVFTDLTRADLIMYDYAVAWAVENNITTGKTPTKFAPRETCTRGQFMTFLYRCINQAQ